MFIKYLFLFFIFLLITILFAIIFYTINISLNFIKNGSSGKAVVLKKREFCLAVVFEYRGKRVKIKFFNEYNFLYHKNDIVKILYLEKKHKVKINSFLSLWFIPILLTTINLMLFYTIYYILIYF